MALTSREIRLVAFLFTFFGLGTYILNYHYTRHSFGPVSDGDTTFRAQPHSSRLYWGHASVPETVTWHKVAGMTFFRNLYAFNHTLYIVTTEPQLVPERRWILSKGKTLKEKDENEPDEKTLAIVSPIEAKRLFGTFASVIDGVSFMQTDSPQFLAHMYHFIVEIFALWIWRGYTSPDLDSIFGGPSRPLPTRWIFPNSLRSGWIDKAGMNIWALRAAVPSISLEFADDWQHRMDQARPYVLEYVVLGDRATWHRMPSWKEPGKIFPVETRPDYWRPIRELVTQFATQPQEEIEPPRPVITYISRQKTGRRLKDKDHEQLVAALKEFAKTENYELHIPAMEDLDKSEQIRLLSRTTILLGVHGNGLSGQIWLKPSPRTTVIEIYFAGGFLYDYEYTARVLGLKHYGVWHDKYFTFPDLPRNHGPEGFHGNQITVDATAVVGLIHRRLTLDDPDQA